MLLRLDDNTLEFLENRKLLVCRIDFGIALLLTREETDFFQLLQFTLDVARIFFDELSESADMRAEVWVLGVHYYYLASDS